MASIYDKASLVLIPSGTKTSKVYSQVPTNGDGDFTFSRSTAATRVNASGNIEKETQNLLKYSNTLSNADWVKTNTSVTGGQSGYDGSSDAWLLDITGGTDSQRLEQSVSLSGVQTFSIYAKAGTEDWIRLRVNTSGITVQSYFDLANGALGVTQSGLIDRKIEDVGGGWYRCSISYNETSSLVRIYPALGNGVVVGGTGNIYIQDAQLEQGLVARDYIETTTTAIYGGITDNVPRLDYTDSSCPALLLEPQRTNVVVDSENFIDSSWSYAGTYGPNTTMNQAVSPEGFQNAALIAAAGAGNDRIQDNLGSQSNNLLYSIFVKSAGVDTRVKLRNPATNSDARWDVGADGSVTFYSSTETNYGQEDYGNGWYRIWFEAEMDGSTTFFQFYPDEDNGDGSAYVYGAQAEQGSYATSYIPTYGSAVTRNNDTYKKLGFGNTSTEGTFFAEFEVKKIESANGQYMYGLGVGTTDLGSFFATASGALSIISNGSKIEGYNNGYATSLFSFTPLIGDIVKIAIRYDGTNVVGFVNGVKQTIKTDNVTGVKNTIRVNHGEKSSHATKQLLYIPTALTDQEAIDLTTI